MNNELRDKLLIDYRVSGMKRNGWACVRSLLFPNYSLQYIVLMRKMTNNLASDNIFRRLWGKWQEMRLTRLAAKTGFYIPRDVFGEGLYIPHFGSVVVNPNARIGRYCQINNNVVIGQVRGKSPVIGDCCFIGSGAVICGDIHLGNNVWVGANSVVTKSFEEDNVLIAGNPARVICKKEKNWIEEFKEI